MAVELVVSPRWISTWFSPSGREDIKPSSCWKSSRVSWQLYFWAMELAWKMLLSNWRGVSAVFSTKKVTRNIRSLRLCRSCNSFLASLP